MFLLFDLDDRKCLNNSTFCHTVNSDFESLKQVTESTRTKKIIIINVTFISNERSAGASLHFIFTGKNGDTHEKNPEPKVIVAEAPN